MYLNSVQPLNFATEFSHILEHLQGGTGKGHKGNVHKLQPHTK
jgi:hypothetical protein